LQYKKNLYKILFITILLGFIISLAGCSWLSLGLLNIFDPQAQIRVNYTEVNLEDGSISLEIFSLNEVEFIGTGFEYEYYVGTTKIAGLSKTVGATFYVAPSTSPGTPGDITTIDNLPLYFQEVQDYMTSNPLVVEMTCTVNMIGTDGAGHNITTPITVDLPALQPGIDFTPPEAAFSVVPDTTGTVPFTVTFDASGSTDAESGIASYNWDFGDGSSATGVMPAAHTYTATGTYIVKLTVIDFFGNAGIYTETITVTSVPSTITLEANPSTVTAAGDTSIITATVKDASGSVVTDGAIVTFSTSLGTLSAVSVTTINGIATTILTTVTGSATVTAICAPATNTVVVICP
jgi:PKD repeat protein